MAAPNFRGLRLDISVALKGRRRTLYETAKALGRRSGDIQRLVRQMHAERMLEASDPEPTRGTFYWLDERFHEDLEDALRTTQPAGQLAPGQRLMRVHAENSDRLYEVLQQVDLTASVSWAAECGEDGSWFLALTPEASWLEAEQLQAALRRSGFDCRRDMIGEVLTGDALRRVATSIVERATKSGLIP
jgi:hypothetical protein